MTSRAKLLKVLYGSQTGNAEAISKHLCDEALQRGFSAERFVLDDYDKVSFGDDCILLIVISTTGDGDFPDNTTKFFRWTRRGKKDELETAFKGKRFTVLALGDTNYTNFCQTGKRIERRLLELGAITFLNKALADDAVGLESVIDPWVDSLWATLPSILEFDEAKAKAFADVSSSGPTRLPIKKAKTDENLADAEATQAVEQSVIAVESKATIPDEMDSIPSIYTPAKIPIDLSNVPASSDLVLGSSALPLQTLNVRESSECRQMSPAASLFHLFTKQEGNDPFAYNINSPFPAKIVSHRYLSGPKALKRVLELTIDMNGMNWNPKAGSVISILAPNPDEVVLPLLKRLKIAGTAVLEVLPATSGSKTKYTAYEAFKYFLDLTPPLRKPFLRVLAEYATNEQERAALLFLTSTPGAGLFKTLKQANPSFADLLETFPSLSDIPMARILENLPRLQSRFYSITHIDSEKQTVCVAFNIVEYTNEVKNQTVRGLCSGYLESLVLNPSLGMTIPLFPKPNASFMPPEDALVPLVMISAGTGVTPFLSFLQERRRQRDESSAKIGESVLFHGRRFADDAGGDRIYGQEIDQYVVNGVLTQFIAAISREECVSSRGKYVQNAVECEGAIVWKSLSLGGHLYVCGGVEMARDVHASLAKVCVTFGGMDDAEAKKFLKALAAEGRYLKEIW
ncbi:hypothetical protein HDU82_008848 [Entophlyctis luteolus]|nr:hypothetical protein HDU82_008848 [Entophlyctis luteolus]